MTARPHLSPVRWSLAVAALAIAAGCADDSADTELFFEPFNTAQSIDPTRPVRIQERYLAYLASEFETAQANYNADSDASDMVPFVINMVARTTGNVGVAAEDMALIADQLFLVVDEAKDEVDWNNDGDGTGAAWNDLVLVRCSAASPAVANVVFVATLNSGFTGPLPATPPRMLATDTRLYFTTSAADLMTTDDTTLAYVTTTAPGTVVRVKNADAANTLQPSLMGVDEDLLFLTLNETTEGRDLNGDGDGTPNDQFVLALVDANATTPLLREVGLALPSSTSPARALKRAASDWVVAFLVDELAQGATSRNNATMLPSNWLPTHCTGGPDTDTNDDVLAYLEYAGWLTSSTVTNTGFAGIGRVLAMKSGTQFYVATIVPEADENNCMNAGGLNDDTDRMDRVLRWARVETVFGASGIFRDKDGLLALADTAGGTHGATDLGGRFLAVVDEAADQRNHDGLVLDHTVLGWLDPTDGNAATWTFDHGTGAGIQAAGTAWLAERPERDYLLLAFQEAVFGLPLNNSDPDMNDSVPTIGRFDPGNADDFDFDQPPAVAVVADDAGISLQAGAIFYRVDENADNRDWNGDGLKNDHALLFTEQGNPSNSSFLSSLNDLSASAVITNGNVGAAFIYDESEVGAAGTDLNGDGDPNDFTLRWMRIGP
jgi:hypothetical protein